MNYKRIVTGLVLSLGLIGVNFWVPEKIFFILFSAVMVLAAWEWTQFVSRMISIRMINLLILSSLGILCFFKLSVLQISLLACFFWGYVFLKIIQAGPNIRAWWLVQSRINILLAGVWILVPMWILGYNLHAHLTQGPRWFFILLLIVMGTDIGGYLVGKKWGHYKLAPALSPGKTLEGCLGGLGFAQIFAWCGLIQLNLIQLTQLDWVTTILWTVIILCVSVFSIVGDLTESLFKRVSGLKDSGNILPGHGGILDRIDGITAALPIFCIFKLLV